MFQHTAARRRLDIQFTAKILLVKFQHTAARRRLATVSSADWAGLGFQHTAARRRLVSAAVLAGCTDVVSTHSRPKAAGSYIAPFHAELFVSTHSRPKAAGHLLNKGLPHTLVSTHSRPKAAGTNDSNSWWNFSCFNTQPPEGGWSSLETMLCQLFEFQHTAARRRLDDKLSKTVIDYLFQHTAARRRLEH